MLMISKKIVKNTVISLLFRIGKRKISFRYAVGQWQNREQFARRKSS